MRSGRLPQILQRHKHKSEEKFGRRHDAIPGETLQDSGVKKKKKMMMMTLMMRMRHDDDDVYKPPVVVLQEADSR